MNNTNNTSWQPVAPWYSKLVGEKGQYYHEHVVIPGVLRLLDLKSSSMLLDIACGQGVLGRAIPKDMIYTGIDIAPALIASAKKSDHTVNHEYLVADATGELPLKKWKYSHAAIILALQNIEHADRVIANCAKHVLPDGKLVIVLNHPAFRIPRQSGWGIDEGNKLQYRRINRYLSPLKIPIDMHPGLPRAGENSLRGLPRGGEAPLRSRFTWTFHQPISYYVSCLARYGFALDAFEEWTSDKESVGKSSKMENRSRSEIPLFLALRARCQSK